MKPYYETENGVLYHGACLEIMPELEPVDLVLTDPPYGVDIGNQSQGKGGGVAQKNDYGKNSWDKTIPDKKYFEAIKNISKHQIVFGGNYFIEHLNNSPCWIVWDKDNGKSDFADCELAWTNFDSAVRKFKYRWSGMLQENAGKFKEKRYHPTQKPVGLFKQILLKYSKEGQTILDTHAGSGTTGLACEELGKRKYILIEREENYCEIIAKRIEKETRQLRLFP